MVKASNPNWASSVFRHKFVSENGTPVSSVFSVVPYSDVPYSDIHCIKYNMSNINQ